MPLGTWYVISREVQNNSPPIPPNDAKNTPKIPPKTSYLGPPKGFSKFGNYVETRLNAYHHILTLSIAPVRS